TAGGRFALIPLAETTLHFRPLSGVVDHGLGAPALWIVVGIGFANATGRHLGPVGGIVLVGGRLVANARATLLGRLGPCRIACAGEILLRLGQNLERSGLDQLRARIVGDLGALVGRANRENAGEIFDKLLVGGLAGAVSGRAHAARKQRRGARHRSAKKERRAATRGNAVEDRKSVV